MLIGNYFDRLWIFWYFYIKITIFEEGSEKIPRETNLRSILNQRNIQNVITFKYHLHYPPNRFPGLSALIDLRMPFISLWSSHESFLLWIHTTLSIYIWFSWYLCRWRDEDAASRSLHRVCCANLIFSLSFWCLILWSFLSLAARTTCSLDINSPVYLLKMPLSSMAPSDLNTSAVDLLLSTMSR